MRSIKELNNLGGKRALVRVDYNVPIKNSKIEDNFRIKKSLPTIEYLRGKGAKIVLITHLGKDDSQSLEPVIKEFFKLSQIPESEISFFENARKFPGEENNDPVFAKELAALGDFFVNDAFSVSHREHASVVGVPKYLPSYAGFQLEEEVKNLSEAIQNPSHPFLFIMGGAKFSTKMPLIKKYLEVADHVFVGGALANDFLKAQGFEVGKSLVDTESYGIEEFLNNKKLILPRDVVVNEGTVKKSHQLSEEDVILDIGPESIEVLKGYINDAKLILWNGPLGKYEAGGGGATKEILKLVAESGARSIIGGGDTVALISEMKMENKFSFVSTGGGATLEFLFTGTLPGIEALE